MILHQRNLGYKHVLLICFTILLCLSCINPVYPSEMFLQHFITVIMIIILAAVARKNSLSDRSFTLIIAFLALHLIGARWIYSYVPYREWIGTITGNLLQGLISSERNNYDRFVHLMFGLMILSPLKEIYARWFKAPAGYAILLAFLSILGISLVYEVFEWGLTLVMSPEDAEDYNGQQGDMWDAQKDMALALAGAALAVIIRLISAMIFRRNLKED